MKFEFPKLRDLLKVLIIALVLAIGAFLVYPLLNLAEVGAQRIFSYAVLAGVILGGFLVQVKIKLPQGKLESIFVGNLAFKMPANALQELFEQYGEVHAVRLMTDRVTRRPRGFGFVEMNHRAAMAAIAALDGTEFYGRELKVNIANEKKPRQEATSEA